MLKKLLIGALLALLVIAIGVWMAPARLASKALERAGDGNNGAPKIRLLGPRGTLWSGSGQLLVNAEPIGNLNWQVRPARLLALEAAVDWQLDAAEFDAAGTAVARPAARQEVFDLRAVKATFSERFLRRTLSPYDIAPAGTLTLNNVDVTDLQLNAAGNWPSQVTAVGNLSWSGGPVSYRLAGQSFDIDLPPMLGDITTSDTSINPGWPELLVTQADDGAPLITARLTPTGSAAIGITRGFTRLAGQPWPGSEPDHAIVLEVEEQLN